MATIRRVVTAQAENGTSVFATVQEVAPQQAGAILYSVWGWDTAPRLPFRTTGDAPQQLSVFPSAGGVRVNVAEFPPGMGDGSQPYARDVEAFERLNAKGGVAPLDADPGMHGTDTADICVVISGEVCVALDSGAEEVLGPGDILLQMGTTHAWRNRTTEPCVVAFVVFGLARDPHE